MPKIKMTEKTHYKESPYDERIEELALDIEAAKGKANKREQFWRRYAVCSTIATFGLVGWGMKEAGALWHETLGVARLQEERAADALEQSGKQAQKISQLREELLEKEKEVQLEYIRAICSLIVQNHSHHQPRQQEQPDQLG